MQNIEEVVDMGLWRQDASVVLPKYQTSGSSGMDLYYHGTEEIILQPLERQLIHTGIHVIVPRGYELQIRPRSGFALRRGITVLNTPGTIDSDYRGEIGVILVNLSNASALISPNERVAQMVLCPVSYLQFQEMTEEEYKTYETKRGEGGFGSTGHQKE